jgi:HEAT repeat protein
VTIRRAAGQEVVSLVADLDAENEVRRESAVARLAVIGTRAVERLVAVLQQPSSARARIGALRALEAIGDPRGLEPATRCLDDETPGIAAAAVDVLRRVLRTEHGTAALDRLTALVLDRSRADALRVAALDAMSEVPARVLAPLRERLRDEPSAALRDRATGEAVPARDPVAELEEAAGQGLPDEPGAIQDLISQAADTAPLPTIHRLITVIRERESAERRVERRAAWTVARGTAHRALAERDSRVALYDLRESIEEAKGPLPVDFVAAVGRIGDASCLEAIATAHAAAACAEDWWKRHLAEAFQEIVQREGLTTRHQAIKRLVARWPGSATELLRGRAKAQNSRRKAQGPRPRS